MTRTKTKRRRVRKRERIMSPVDREEGAKFFWSNTEILRFEIGEDGKKRPVRSDVQRTMPCDNSLDFRIKKNANEFVQAEY